MIGIDPQRFWSMVAKLPDAPGCWLWLGQIDAKGYGRLEFAGKAFRAHRLAAMLNGLDIPAGMVICHKCDVRACVRPDHLFVGTVADNNYDMRSKGRDRYWLSPICKNGHPMSGDNVQIRAHRAGPRRFCKLCVGDGVRRRCRSGRHEWIAANIAVANQHGRTVKICRPCSTDRVRRHRTKKSKSGRPANAELLPASTQPSSAVPPPSPARPEEGGVPTHDKHCVKGKGNGWACDCGADWPQVNGVPV